MQNLFYVQYVYFIWSYQIILPRPSTGNLPPKDSDKIRYCALHDYPINRDFTTDFSFGVIHINRNRHTRGTDTHEVKAMKVSCRKPQGSEQLGCVFCLS